MELQPLLNNSNDIVGQLITEVGQLALWLQAIGLLIVLWIVFQIIALINEKRKRKRLNNIEAKLDKLDKKLDAIILMEKRK